MPGANWRESAISRLETLQTSLPPASDRWSPERPKDPAYRQAKALIGWLSDDLFAPYVEATIDGGIQLEWTRDERELDIEVSPGGAIEYLKVESRAAIAEGPISKDELPRLTDWLLFGR